MFTSLNMKKIDIQEANKHLQMLHVRNVDLERELELKSTQLSQVEAQLEDVTRVKQNELLALSGQLDNLKAKFSSQCKETEQWKMLVHERDVMIAKLQTRCRQLEELESHVYESRPSLEALLSLTYQLDGTEIDSQTAAKPCLADAESEAEYAEPDVGDGPDAEPPELPLSYNLVNGKTSTENGHLISMSKVRRFLQGQNEAADQNQNKEEVQISYDRGEGQPSKEIGMTTDSKMQDTISPMNSDDRIKFGRRTVVEISV